MLIHNLKIAFRNIRKYKNQTLISVIGLAVGFTCFALAMLWIRYEMTFDSFHKNAKNMYVVYTPNSNIQTGYDRITPYPLATYLKETFPEIANAIQLYPPSRGRTVNVEGAEIPALVIMADSSFLRMFDVKILEGSIEFLIIGSNKYAITQEKARQLFGDENPIGKTLYDGRNEICAVVSGMSKQSNYAFDFVMPFGSYVTNPNQMWDIPAGNTIIELFPGTNVEAFEKKLYGHETGEARRNLSKMTIKPLTKLRYLDPNIEKEVTFQHILIFALSGLLVILCSLFNYLTLFMSRFRMRQKELALRVVCGASGISLMEMLSVEFMLTLFFAVVFGFLLTELVHKPFLTLSEIKMELPAIFSESLMYVGGIILVSLLAFWLILFVFRRRNLDVSIRRSNKKLFRKISVVVQLVISVGFAFCTIVILKQMYFLHHTDELGFSFKNRGSILVYENLGNPSEINIDDRLAEVLRSEIPLISQLKQIPEITEVIEGASHLLPQRGRQSREISSWDDKSANVENVSMETMIVSSDYIAFYDFRLIAGDILTDADPASMVLLNESAVKAFGWHDPIGKQFDDGKFTVKGVIKHIYNFAPTIPGKPVVYRKPQTPAENIIAISIGRSGDSGSVISLGRLVLFKYHEGTWKTLMGKIEQLKDEHSITETFNAEEIYDNYLKSEKALLKLLYFVSAICILICVFGFVSLVSLTCEERRKEIAIRKINGATAGNILAMFAKEYILLLFIGAMIAFTTGYFIMQRWLEQYVKQTSISAWIYLSIVFVLALVIVLCVGWQVWRASIENPAEVVKGE